MNMFRMILGVGCIGSACAVASPPSEAVPWTKSFLETRAVSSVERYSLATRGHRFSHTPRQQWDGTVFASSAPLQDWEFDLGVQGRSLPTGKWFLRAEHQLLSDLDHSPCAVTVVADASISGHQRYRTPVFFEIAKTVADVGVGVGRHLIIQKNAYTQIFAYLTGGIGSSKARFTCLECGFQQVFLSRHFFRCSLSHMKTFGRSNEPFRGIGTLKTDVNTVACSYAYRFANGIEGRVTYIQRMLTKTGLRRSTTCQVSVSVPVSL